MQFTELLASDVVLESDSVLESNSSPYFKDSVSDSDAKNSYSNSNPEDSDSSHQDSDSHSAHYSPMMLSHITSCIETVCLRKFNGRLVYFLNSNYLVSLEYQCLFLRSGVL